MISAYGYKWRKRRMGGIFSKEYHAAKERENFSKEQWEKYQNEQLQKVLIYAFEHVPFYRKAFTKNGLNENVLKKITTETLQQLPVLSKEQLRNFGTSTLLSNKKESNGDFFSSSGSTGTPTKILFSETMHQKWYAIFEARVRNWAGVSSFIPRGMIGGRRILPSSKNNPPFYRYNLFEKQVYFSAYHINKKNAENYLHGIRKYDLQYMTGYAMSNFFLARFFKELNLEAPKLKAVITSSEKLTDEMRDLFKEVYHCKTFDGWSGVEACGLISECEHGSLHISPDAGFVEILDDNLQPVLAGVAATVYCTGFLNYDQPLIRYNIGDQIILSKKKCLCKREMPVVQEILGRVEDVIFGKDGREMVRFHSVFNGLKSVKTAQVIQENIETMIIKILPDKKLDLNEERLIRERIFSQLGNINIIIEQVEQIPLNNNGKFQAVISKMKRNNL